MFQNSVLSEIQGVPKDADVSNGRAYTYFSDILYIYVRAGGVIKRKMELRTSDIYEKYLPGESPGRTSKA